MPPISEVPGATPAEAPAVPRTVPPNVPSAVPAGGRPVGPVEGQTRPASNRPAVSVRRLLGRALLLRCPHCGGRGLFASFFTLKTTCPSCGLRIERGESDYFVGAYLFNLIAVELILFVCICGFVAVTWPDVPWDLLTYVSGALMLTGCFVCYPFAKTTWLAVDLAIRPLSDEELQWHRADGAVGDLELPQL